MVTILYNSNIFGIVGSNNNLDYKQSDVIIWDDLNKKIIYKFFIKKKVLNLKFTHDKMIIICQYTIYIFNLENFQLIDNIKTGSNPKGLIGINYSKNKLIIVYPSNEEGKGQLTIKHCYSRKYIYLNPHNNKVSYIGLSFDGLLLATASEDGKKIRIFTTETGEYLEELYRGKEKAEIKYISFNHNNQFIAVSSGKGTIHIWSLAESIKKIKESMKFLGFEEKTNNISNDYGTFSITGKEWSFAQVRLNEPSIFHFSDEKTLIIITQNGKYYKAKIDLKKGGECHIIEQKELF